MNIETARSFLEEAANLETFVRQHGVNPAVLALFKSLNGYYKKIIEDSNLKGFVKENIGLVNAAGLSLKKVAVLLGEAEIQVEEVKMDVKEVLGRCASLVADAEKAGKLYDELNLRASRGTLKDYLVKYKTVREEFANYVGTYLRNSESFREMMRDPASIKNNGELLRNAFNGLERLRRVISLLFNLGVAPRGYEANLESIKQKVSEELPHAA